MTKTIKVLGSALVLSGILVVALAGTVFAANPDAMGPAPNAGDCTPDGSGFDSPLGPNSETDAGSGPVGPAPNSGDGIPDGSGFLP